MNKLEKELYNYKHGFPFLKVVAPATPSEGISVLSLLEQNEAIDYYDRFDGSVVKFVPASGAASRMFKDLFEGKARLESGEELKDGSPVALFLQNIKHFPFFDETLFGNKSPLEVLEYVLGEDGLGYGSKPKGEILFHRYGSEVRSAFEEHLVEAAHYAIKGGRATLHFTVSPEHLKGFEELFNSVRDRYEKRFGCGFNVSFSFQDPETDIVAVNEDNTPFVKDDGTILFRPGGHGALLKNLSRIDSDLIFIKNIDNVVNQRLLCETVRWKKVLAGRLLMIRDKVYSYLRAIESGLAIDLDEVETFLNSAFRVVLPNGIQEGERKEFLRKKLNRPIRVCGMVKNVGEPGGGPFIVYDADGATSLQILEGAQLDKSNPQTAELLSASTHFNPVDIVCVIKDYRGNQFNLSNFVDEKSGFISSKSYEGRPLRAQELPGLWNGSMSDWNTLFIETPLITFNPVKSVTDLLREEHQ